MAAAATGQQQAAPVQTQAPPIDVPSPTALYLDLLRPVDDVRSDMANWSSIELAAFTNAVRDAAAQCTQLQKNPYDGEELLALARICALGQNWPGTYSAARRYSRDPTPAHRTEGFALLVQADLHLDSPTNVFDDLTELRGKGPITAAQEAIFEFAIQSMQISHTAHAVSIALLRQPDLLACLNTCTSDLPRDQAEAAAWRTVTLVHENSPNRVPNGATSAADEIRSAVAARTTPLTTAEGQIADARRQYDSLGQPLPGLPTKRHCANSRMNAPCIALYVIVPEDAPTTPAAMKSVEELDARLPAGQVAELVLSACTGTFGLHAAHTLCSKKPLLRALGASGAPLLVVVNKAGNIRWTTVGLLTWLGPSGTAEVLLQNIAAAQ